MEQVEPHARWPSGDSKPIGRLRSEPDDLKDAFGLEFEEDVDDMDDFKLAAVALPEGGQAWLVRYANAPEPGTVIYADVCADTSATRESVLRVLGLTPDDLNWARDVD